MTKMLISEMDAINIRESRRVYLDKEIDIRKMIHLKNFIKRINEESGLSLVLLDNGSAAFDSLTKSYGMFSGVRALVALKGDSDDQYLDEKIGYYGEKLLIEAVRLNLGTCWVGGTFDEKSKIFDRKPGDRFIGVITMGYCNNEKSFREKIISAAVHRKNRSMNEIYYSDTKNLPHKFIAGIKAIQKAPSAKNSQPVKLKYINHKVIIYVNELNEFDFVDLGIAKYHFYVATGTDFPLGNYAECLLQE